MQNIYQSRVNNNELKRVWCSIVMLCNIVVLCSIVVLWIASHAWMVKLVEKNLDYLDIKLISFIRNQLSLVETTIYAKCTLNPRSCRCHHLKLCYCHHLISCCRSVLDIVVTTISLSYLPIIFWNFVYCRSISILAFFVSIYHHWIPDKCGIPHPYSTIAKSKRTKWFSHPWGVVAALIEWDTRL